MSETTPASRPRFHRVLLALFCTLNGALLFLFLMHLPFGIDPLRLAIVGWAQAHPRIDIVFGIVVVLAAGSFYGLQQAAEQWKTLLLYFKARHAHPGHEAFYSLKEPPFDRKPLLKAYPEIKDSVYDPDVQFRTWCMLRDRHAATPLIASSLTVWNLLRDLYLVALLFLVAFLFGWPLNAGVNESLAFSYLFLFGVQVLFLMFSARGAARRLVYNVLAIELDVYGEAGEKKKKKRKKKRF